MSEHRSMSRVRVVELRLRRRPYLTGADEIGDVVEHYCNRLGDVDVIDRLRIGDVRQAAVGELTDERRFAGASFEYRVLRGLGGGGKLRIRYDSHLQTLAFHCDCYPEDANERTDEVFDRIDKATSDFGTESGIPGDEVVAKPFEVSSALALEVLEVLRLTHIYALKDSHPDELPEDFKPHKWTHEVEFAQQSVDVYRRLLDEMSARDNTGEESV